MTGDQDLLARLDEALRGEAGAVELSALVSRRGTTRFAASHPTHTGDAATVTVQARVAEGRRLGAARVGALDLPSLREAIAAAREVARATRPEPEGAPPPGFDDGRVASPPVEGAWDEATARAAAADRAALLGRAFAAVDAAHLEAAGSLHVTDGAMAVATSAGCRRAHRFTTCKLDLIAGDGRGSGFGAAYGHAIGGCDPDAVARAACERALAGRDPVELPAGEYDVILEPAAVAEVLEWLALTSLSSRPLEDGSSCFAGRLGERVTGANVSLSDDARDPDPIALRAPFDAEGTPKRRVVLLEGGVARSVVNDRRGAARAGAEPTGHAVSLEDDIAWEPASPQHLHLAAGEERAADLSARVERGLLVTRFHYVNGLLDTRRALMTGMTRDGLLLVEDGRVTRGVRNLRWTESLLEALARVDGISRERKAVAAHWSAMTGGGLVVPTLRVRGWRFTGTSGGA